MPKLLAACLASTWLCFFPPLTLARDVCDENQFQPAEAVTVSGVPEQPMSAANGTMVLDVQISATGEVADVVVRRDLAPLTAEAIRSVKTWKFRPAKCVGKPLVSRISVAVNFNPPSSFGGDVPLPPLLPRKDDSQDQSSFQPAGVSFAAMPTYPMDAEQPGTTVLAVTVDEAGKVADPKVLRDSPPFTAKALQAAVRWKFSPATLNGKPLKSQAVVAFVFRRFNMPPALPL